MKYCLLLMLAVLSDGVFANDYCDVVENIVNKGEVVYRYDKLPYFKPPSGVVFYKENITTGDSTKFALTPVLIGVDNSRYLLRFEWDNQNVGPNDMPEVDSVFMMDFNKDGLNELVIVTKWVGYLDEYSQIGAVMYALVAPDQNTIVDPAVCAINGYPYINDHLAGIRTAKVSGRDVCEEKFCNGQQIKNELKRIQGLSREEFLSEAHALALSGFKSKMVEMAARISSAALVYPEALSDRTVDIFNDMGFFKEQNKQYDQAVRILKPVTEKYPDRAVAFLNIGDAYNGLKMLDPARNSYVRYVELMKRDGKERKVPKRVLDFIGR